MIFSCFKSYVFCLQDNSVECFRRACKIFSLDSEQVMCSIYDLFTYYVHDMQMAVYRMWRRQYIHAITNYTCTFGSVAAHLGYFWANNLVFPKRYEQFQGLPTTNRSRSKFDDVPFPFFFFHTSLMRYFLSLITYGPTDSSRAADLWVIRLHQLEGI